MPDRPKHLSDVPLPALRQVHEALNEMVQPPSTAEPRDFMPDSQIARAFAAGARSTVNLIGYEIAARQLLAEKNENKETA